MLDSILQWLRQRSPASATLIVGIVAIASFLAWIVPLKKNAIEFCQMVSLCRTEAPPKSHFHLRDPTVVRIYFDFMKSTLDEKAQEQAQKVAELLRNDPSVVAVLQPYSDVEVYKDEHIKPEDEEPYFKALATERGTAVRKELVQFGIPEDRLELRDPIIATTDREPRARSVFVYVGVPE